MMKQEERLKYGVIIDEEDMYQSSQEKSKHDLTKKIEFEEGPFDYAKLSWQTPMPVVTNNLANLSSTKNEFITNSRMCHSDGEMSDEEIIDGTMVGKVDSGMFDEKPNIIDWLRQTKRPKYSEHED